MNDFDFKRADALAQEDGIGARAYTARVAEEDGAALVGHVAQLRRAVSQLAAAAFYDLTDGLRAVNPAASSEVRAELENLIIGSQRLGNAAHALDVAAQRAHWAAYGPAPKAETKQPREAAPAPTRAQSEAQHEAEMGDEWQPDLMEGEFSRDEDAPDIGQDLPESAPASATGAARVVNVPAVADMPKIPVTTQANGHRRQFWAVVNKQGLSSSPAQRDARLAAIGARIGREVISINTLTDEEWESVINGVEFQSLVW